MESEASPKNYWNRIFHKENISEFTQAKCGAPESSVSGPLLFLIYINDIVTSDSKTAFRPFADDNALFFTNETIDQLEADSNDSLQNNRNWLKANKSTLNVDKSNILVFDISNNPNKKAIILSVDSKKLEQKSYPKYLGVTIDNRHMATTYS